MHYFFLLSLFLLLSCESSSPKVNSGVPLPPRKNTAPSKKTESETTIKTRELSALLIGDKSQKIDLDYEFEKKVLTAVSKFISGDIDNAKSGLINDLRFSKVQIPSSIGQNSVSLHIDFLSKISTDFVNLYFVSNGKLELYKDLSEFKGSKIRFLLNEGIEDGVKNLMVESPAFLPTGNLILVTSSKTYIFDIDENETLLSWYKKNKETLPMNLDIVLDSSRKIKSPFHPEFKKVYWHSDLSLSDHFSKDRKHWIIISKARKLMKALGQKEFELQNKTNLGVLCPGDEIEVNITDSKYLQASLRDIAYEKKTSQSGIYFEIYERVRDGHRILGKRNEEFHQYLSLYVKGSKKKWDGKKTTLKGKSCEEVIISYPKKLNKRKEKIGVTKAFTVNTNNAVAERRRQEGDNRKTVELEDQLSIWGKIFVKRN